MKGKKLKKLSKLISIELNRINEEKCKVSESVPYSPFIPYSGDLSSKFLLLVKSILEYPNNIRINIFDGRIEIGCEDISTIKVAFNSPNIPVNSDKNIRINIDNNGFSISYGFSQFTRCEDPNMYSEVLPMAKGAMDIRNKNDFFLICENIYKESGLLRDFNLDELLDS